MTEATRSLLLSWLVLLTLARHSTGLINGAESFEQYKPGGGPQGSILTVILFDLKVNVAGAPCPILSLLPPCVAGPEPARQQAGPLPLCHLEEKTLKKKYVDDLSFLESINLRLSLIPSIPIIGPPNQHEQPGLHLPVEQSVLQHQLADLLVFTNDNKMKINFKKTKILPFNVSYTRPNFWVSPCLAISAGLLMSMTSPNVLQASSGYCQV